MNPLWVDARDLLTSQGHSLNTYNLNNAMDFLANNPQLRPSVVKSGASGSEAAIGAGLGAPTDQIVSTPLPPPRTNRSSPVKSSGGGGGRSDASTGGSARTGPAPAPPVAKPQPPGPPVAKPQTVNAEEPVSAAGDPLQKLEMREESPAAPSPVAPASAAPAGTDSGITGGRLAVGAAGVTALLAALLGMRGGRTSGARPSSAGVAGPSSAAVLAGAKPYGTPNVMSNASAMPMQPFGTPGAFKDPLAGMQPYGTPGAMTPPPDPLAQLLPYGTPNAMGENPPNQSPVPYTGAAPSGASQGTPAVGTLEDIISQLVKQAPQGQAMAPSGPANMAPSAAPSVVDLLMHLLGTEHSQISGSR